MTSDDDLEPPRQRTSAGGGSGRSSADPNLLMQYAHGAHDLVGPVDAVLGRLRSVRVPTGLHVALTPNDVVGAVARYDQDLVGDSDRVRRIATAFAETAGMTQLAQSNAVGVETWPIWAQGVAHTTDDELDAQIQADIAQATRNSADQLAEEFRTAVHNNDPAALKSLMARLTANTNDPVFTTEFFQRLGPDDTYLFVEHLHDWNNFGPWNPSYNGDTYKDFLAPFDLALATAEPHLSDDFVHRLMYSGDDFRPRNVFTDILRWGTYDDRLLVPAADEIIFHGRNDDGAADELATALEAVSRNSAVAARYLTEPTPLTDSSDDRLQQLLWFGSDVVAAEGTVITVVDPRVRHAFDDVLNAAAAGDANSVRQLLTDIGNSRNSLSFYFQDRGAATDITNFVVEHLDVVELLPDSDRLTLIDTVLTAPGADTALVAGVNVLMQHVVADASYGSQQDLEAAVTQLAAFDGLVRGRALKKLADDHELTKTVFEDVFGVVTTVASAPLGPGKGIAVGITSTFAPNVIENVLGIEGGFDTLNDAGRAQRVVVGAAKLAMLKQLMISRPDLFQHDATGGVRGYSSDELNRIVSGSSEQDDLFANHAAALLVDDLVNRYGNASYQAWTAGWSG